MIANNVVIVDHDHKIMENGEISGSLVTATVVIEDNVWIGANVVITKGVTIGTGSIIGAGSVVTKDVEPHTMVAGVPAEVVKKIIQ